MKHISVAWKLREIADLLELIGESSFKIRAYRQAATRLEELTIDLETLWHEGRLTEIDGIGKSIAGRIEELLNTGDTPLLRELKVKVPEGLAELLDIPGIGPKMAWKLRDILGITNVTELEAALQAHKIRDLPGMNSRTEANLLRGIKQMRAEFGQVLLGLALPFGRELQSRLLRVPGVVSLEISGEGRRYRESISQLTLIGRTTQPQELLQVFKSLPECREVLVLEENRSIIMTRFGIKVELVVSTSIDYPWQYLQTTGPENHIDLLKKLAFEHQWEWLNGQWVNAKGESLVFNSEQEIYQKLGLSFVIPELREEEEIIRMAQGGWLPKSVQLKQIRGDLHLHTRWSDGVNSIEEMVDRARKMGYEYIAVCDHSRSLKVAKGMSLELLHEQMQTIDDLNSKLTDFRVLKGIEVDILKDGTLDFPDTILSKLDLVVASIHSGFRASEEELTNRLIKAMENPHVDIIAHPTGRLIQRREPYPIDIQRVIDVAKKTGTVLEINATPDRLDLCDEYLKLCKAAGVKIAINSDAHSIEQLGYMEFGVGMARRGWLEEVDVINTYSLDQLLKFLQ